MKSLTEIFNQIKNEVKNNKLTQVETSLIDIEDFYIEIDENNKSKRYYYLSVNLKNGEVTKNITTTMTNEAFKSLLKFYNITPKLLTSLKDFNDHTRSHIIKTLKVIASKSENKKIVLHFNKKDKTIERITTKERSNIGIPDEPLFNSIETLFNDNPNLVVDLYSVTPTMFRLNVRDPKNPWQLQGFSDEEFTGGFTTVKDYDKGTFFFPYTNRSICTNGMGMEDDNALKFTKNPNEREWGKFFSYFNELKKNNYKSDNFELKAKLALRTPASYSELVNASKLLKDASVTLDNDAELFIPLKKIAAEYMTYNVDLDALSNKQLATAVTPMTIWDMIQVLTDFASNRKKHIYELSKDKAIELQMKAGKILNSKYDTNNIISVNPYNKKL